MPRARARTRTGRSMRSWVRRRLVRRRQVARRGTIALWQVDFEVFRGVRAKYVLYD
ncbi:MAG: hypothetical protein H5T95_09260 [Firmicutes bacterium]|nr:hypothetical protein [Bacillota bacterium]